MIVLITNRLFPDSEFKTEAPLEALSWLNQLESLGVDLETRGFDPYTCELVCCQIGNKERQYVIDCETIDIRLFKELLETKELILHHSKFDLRFFYHKDIVPTKVFDTMVAEDVLNLGLIHRRALDYCLDKYFSIKLDKSVRTEIHKEGLTTRVIKYSAEDVKYLLQLKEIQLIKAEEQDLLSEISFENAFVPVLAYMEYCGIKLDSEKWSNKIAEDKKNYLEAMFKLDKFVIDNHSNSIFVDNQLELFSDKVNCNINWASSKQVVKFFKHLGIDTKTTDKKTGKVKDSVDSKLMSLQKNKFSFITPYVDYKEKEKEVSTYGESFLKVINPVSKRIHTSFEQMLDTGRISSGRKGKNGELDSPNLQNLPAEDRVRGCFVADKGNSLIIADYTGQEIIVLANKSLDKTLVDFYLKSEGEADLHSFIAAKIYPELEGVSVADIKTKHKDKRYIAKTGTFAMFYGAQGPTVAKNVNITLEEGEQVYKSFFSAFSGLKIYFDKVKKQALTNGYILIDEITRRKCYVDNYKDFKDLQNKIYSPGFWDEYKQEKTLNSSLFINILKPMVRKYFKIRGKLERDAMNFPIQGCSATITKWAGIMIFKEILKQGLFKKVLLPNMIHDEWIVEVPDNLAEQWKTIIKDCMEKAGSKFCTTVPLKVEPIIAKKWIK